MWRLVVVMVVMVVVMFPQLMLNRTFGIAMFCRLEFDTPSWSGIEWRKERIERIERIESKKVNLNVTKQSLNSKMRKSTFEVWYKSRLKWQFCDRIGVQHIIFAMITCCKLNFFLFLGGEKQKPRIKDNVIYLISFWWNNNLTQFQLAFFGTIW